MRIALAIITFILALLLYTAWLNGLFLRCPYCRKIGSWRFDPAEPEVTRSDEDGVVQTSRHLKICRTCGGRVLDVWSDHDGRVLKKAGE